MAVPPAASIALHMALPSVPEGAGDENDVILELQALIGYLFFVLRPTSGPC